MCRKKELLYNSAGMPENERMPAWAVDMFLHLPDLIHLPANARSIESPLKKPTRKDPKKRSQEEKTEE